MKWKKMKKLVAWTATLGCIGMLFSALPVQAQEGYIRSVYSNEWVTPAQAMSRPIAVMMPTDKIAQPSYGIGNAKILYEIMEEGNISRQMAVIDNWQGMPKIGNIRSSRNYYLQVATEWDPILIHFGGVYYMAPRLAMGDINNLSGTAEYGSGGKTPGSEYFYRTTDKKAPHNAFISADGIVKASNQLGYSLAIRQGIYNPKHFTFAEGINTLAQYGESAKTANVINLAAIFGYTKSAFTYNAADGLYYKTLHGSPQTDGVSGQQISFANVIVQNTKWAPIDAKGYLAFQLIDNTEDGYYFTKGKVIHVIWQKASDYSPTIYYDDLGNEIQLNEGKTYIAVAQKGKAVAFQ